MRPIEHSTPLYMTTRLRCLLNMYHKYVWHWKTLQHMACPMVSKCALRLQLSLVCMVGLKQIFRIILKVCEKRFKREASGRWVWAKLLNQQPPDTKQCKHHFLLLFYMSVALSFIVRRLLTFLINLCPCCLVSLLF